MYIFLLVMTEVWILSANGLLVICDAGRDQYYRKEFYDIILVNKVGYCVNIFFISDKAGEGSSKEMIP